LGHSSSSSAPTPQHQPTGDQHLQSAVIPEAPDSSPNDHLEPEKSCLMAERLIDWRELRSPKLGKNEENLQGTVCNFHGLEKNAWT